MKMIVDYKRKTYRVQFEDNEPVMVEVLYRMRCHWYGYRSGRQRTQVARCIWAARNVLKPKAPSNTTKAVIAKAMEQCHDLAS